MENEQWWQPPGRRVKFWRELAGMTQGDLAARVNRTQGWLSQIENLHVSLDSRTIVDGLAQALGLHRNQITGEPLPARTADDMSARMSLQQVRRALLVPDDPTPPRDLATLFGLSDQAMKARMWCDYGGLGSLLAPVLADARTLYDEGRHRDEALKLLVQAGVTGALAFKPIGEIDMAQRLADRARIAASELGDPVYVAAAEFAEAQCVFAVGNSKAESLRIAERAADRLAVDGTAGDDTAAWLTMLHLHAALSSAALHRDDTAKDHVKVAGQLVRGVSETSDPWRMEANPANVLTWEIGVNVENGSPEEADVLARRVNLFELKTPQRRARVHLDHARGLFLTRRYDEAVEKLLAADDTASADIRRRSSVLEMTSFLVRTAPHRGGSAALQELAGRVGVGPETLAVAA